MFIWWGSRPVESQAGYVAETCPRCRQARVCRLIAHGLRPHLYFLIPVGRTLVQRHEAQCLECSHRFAVEAAYYLDVVPEPGALGPVMMRTNPSVDRSVGSSPETDRLHRTIQAFLHADSRLTARYAKGSTVIDLRTGLSMLSVVVVFACAFPLVGLEQEWLVYGWGGALVLAIVNVIASMWTERARFIRSRLAGELSQRLNQQQARATDIERAFRRLEKHGYGIARHLVRSWLTVPGSTS